MNSDPDTLEDIDQETDVTRLKAVIKSERQQLLVCRELLESVDSKYRRLCQRICEEWYHL